MDLFEYQAKELFAKHGVPVAPGGGEHAGGGARGRRAGSADAVVVKAQVKTGGRGKAGGVKLAADGRRGDERPRTSSAWTSRATRCTRVLVDRPATSRRSTTSPSCSTGPTARTWRWLVEGGMEIEQLAVERPEALAQDRRSTR